MVGKLGDFEDEETKLPSRHGVLKLTSFIIIELLPIARANYYYIRLIVVNYYNVNVTDFLKRAVFSFIRKKIKRVSSPHGKILRTGYLLLSNSTLSHTWEPTNDFQTELPSVKKSFKIADKENIF